MNPQGYDTQPMTLASGNIPPLVRLLQAYIEKGSKVIVQAKKEVTKRQQHVIKIKYPYSPLECQQFVMLSVNFQVLRQDLLYLVQEREFNGLKSNLRFLKILLQ